MQALPPPPPAVAAPPLDRSEATTGDLRVAAALTDAQVRVDSSFRGASIVLYGAVFNPTPEPADVHPSPLSMVIAADRMLLPENE